MVALFVCASPTFAQSGADPDADATMRFGPLALKSTLTLSNVGVDKNVFNQADAEKPQSDFTLTFTPTTNVWLRMGRTWFSGIIKVDWVYYNRFATERSANGTYTAGVTRTFNRLSLRGNAGHIGTRERPGFEIDARSQRVENSSDAEVSLRTLSRTYLGIRAAQRHVSFNQGAVFLGVSLAEELNRTSTGTAFLVRHEMTPLTTLSLEISRDNEQFELSPDRNADSTRVAGRAVFQPLAVVNGFALVGYRRFTPVHGDVPPYRGVVADVGLSYSLRGSTKLSVSIGRDVQHSFHDNEPYYVDTGITGSVQQQVYRSFDVLARMGTRRLAYRNRTGAAVPLSNRTDIGRTFALGAGYRLGSDKRVGFLVERQRRGSDVERDRYSGLRFGFSLTYET
ncbi:MAG: outer membrane beta-barrel protein [Acidobacteria bacterium]|nr:outer membrane beta-barrel protein [Acidobacteriota bacterium]